MAELGVRRSLVKLLVIFPKGGLVAGADDGGVGRSALLSNDDVEVKSCGREVDGVVFRTGIGAIPGGSGGGDVDDVNGIVENDGGGGGGGGGLGDAAAAACRCCCCCCCWDI